MKKRNIFNCAEVRQTFAFEAGSPALVSRGVGLYRQAMGISDTFFGRDLFNNSIGVLSNVLYEQLYTIAYTYVLCRRAGGVFTFGQFKVFSSLKRSASRLHRDQTLKGPLCKNSNQAASNFLWGLSYPSIYRIN